MQNLADLDRYDTVALDEENLTVDIIDQTKLPGKLFIRKLSTIEAVKEAIVRLQVRGAPAIGVSAAFAMYIAAVKLRDAGKDRFLQEYERQSALLASARPTAVNLFWALERMRSIVRHDLATEPLDKVLARLGREAKNLRDEDVSCCRQIGREALTLLNAGDGLLTHCNAGRLATVRYGTATAPMYLGQKEGYDFKVFVDETRPLLQGARLTTLELMAAGVNVTLICDNMAAACMQKGWIQAVLVGCDRVARNGDTANKIGTSLLALAAHYYKIPFYVCAPTSTLDPATACGRDIPIEERSTQEVTSLWYKESMAPAAVPVFNPAFDVTDHHLITAIITEKGIARPPYRQSLAAILAST